MKRFASSLVLACLALAGAAAIEARVVSVSGKAERQKGSEWVALEAGDVLKTGAVVQTGFKSQVVLNIKSSNEESTVTVAPLSRMTIEQLSEKGTQDTTSLFLDSGSLKSSIKKTEDRRANYQVRTSVATASVRGTEFKISMNYRAAAIETLDGSVACWNHNVQKPQIFSTDTSEVEPSDTAPGMESTPAEGMDTAAPVVAAAPSEPTPAATTATPASEISYGAAPRGSFTVVAGQQASLLTGGNSRSPVATSSSQALAFKTTVNASPVAELVHTAEVPPASSFTHTSVQNGEMPSGNGGGGAEVGGSSGGSASPAATAAATSGGISISVGSWN